jgi:hypothetical protein
MCANNETGAKLELLHPAEITYGKSRLLIEGKNFLDRLYYAYWTEGKYGRELEDLELSKLVQMITEGWKEQINSIQMRLFDTYHAAFNKTLTGFNGNRQLLWAHFHKYPEIWFTVGFYSWASEKLGDDSEVTQHYLELLRQYISQGHTRPSAVTQMPDLHSTRSVA